jgi:hypothetical protein
LIIDFINQFKIAAKMLICCMWKGCEFAFEEMAALQEHVITKHLQQQPPQQQQLNLANQNEEQEDGGPMTKKAKMNEEKECKMISQGGQR